MKRQITVAIAAGLALMPAVAFADGKKKGSQDPNRIICRTDDNTGSRLSQTKRCMTAQQWLEDKLQNQRDIEKIQQNRYKNQ